MKHECGKSFRSTMVPISDEHMRGYVWGCEKPAGHESPCGIPRWDYEGPCVDEDGNDIR